MRKTGGRLRTRMLEMGKKECKSRTDNEEDGEGKNIKEKEDAGGCKGRMQD